MPCRHRLRRSLRIEPLEERRVLAALTVSVLADNVDSDADLTLREAIAVVNHGSTVGDIPGLAPGVGRPLTSGELARIVGLLGVNDQIAFAPSLTGDLQLSAAGQLEIKRSVKIVGPGADLRAIHAYNPTIDLDDGARVFAIIDDNQAPLPPAVEISGLALQGGDPSAGPGGAIYSEGFLAISDVRITDSRAFQGGGLYQKLNRLLAAPATSLRIIDSTIDNNEADVGGGLYFYLDADEAAEIDGATFENNAAIDGDGGGADFWIHRGASVVISNSIFRLNAADQSGGGLHALVTEEASLLITRSVLDLNVAHATNSISELNSDIGGGGAKIENGVWNVQTSTLDSRPGIVEIAECRISSNTTGRFFPNSSPPHFYAGHIGAGGGLLLQTEVDALVPNGAITLLKDSEISGNTAHNTGGGIAFSSRNVDTGVVAAWSEIANTTISNNTATTGGGIFFDLTLHRLAIPEKKYVLRHSTVTANTAGFFPSDQGAGYIGGSFYGGGGIFVGGPVLDYFPVSSDDYTLGLLLDHSIIANNIHHIDDFNVSDDLFTHHAPDVGSLADIIRDPSTAPNYEGPSIYLNATYTLIGNPIGPLVGGVEDNGINPNRIFKLTIADPSTNLIGANPQLGPLINNDGFLLPDGSRLKTHALLTNSPAIDAGKPALTAGQGGTPQFDQRGTPYSRIYDWLGVGPEGVPRIDIGAFELQPLQNGGRDADFDDNLIVDGADFLIWQRGFGIASGATNAQGDADLDAAVDHDDLTIWKEDFGTTMPPLASAATPAAAAAVDQRRIHDPPATAPSSAASSSIFTSSPFGGIEDQQGSPESQARPAKSQAVFAVERPQSSLPGFVYWFKNRRPLDSAIRQEASPSRSKEAAVDDVFSAIGL